MNITDVIDKGAGRIIGVVGSREYHDRQFVELTVSHLLDAFPLVTILSGGARGVDTWAVDAARRREAKTLVYHALWEEQGKSAGYKRNEKIVRFADLIIAFWDEQSKGTKHTIDIAVRERVPMIIFGLNGEMLFDTASAPANYSVKA